MGIRAIINKKTGRLVSTIAGDRTYEASAVLESNPDLRVRYLNVKLPTGYRHVDASRYKINARGVVFKSAVTADEIVGLRVDAAKIRATALIRTLVELKRRPLTKNYTLQGQTYRAKASQAKALKDALTANPGMSDTQVEALAPMVLDYARLKGISNSAAADDICLKWDAALATARTTENQRQTFNERIKTATTEEEALAIEQELRDLITAATQPAA